MKRPDTATLQQINARHNLQHGIQLVSCGVQRKQIEKEGAQQCCEKKSKFVLFHVSLQHKGNISVCSNTSKSIKGTKNGLKSSL
ncbi:hypothetical protein O5541_27325 [Escherichia coli]|nr:hypothetical protein [Escherichia coli]